jgi:threonine synthase
MGVPIRRLLCASNTNRVLADFIATGVYDISARELVKTPSPSMDILISSNLERLLFDLPGVVAVVRGWMDELRATRKFAVGGELLERLQEVRRRLSKRRHLLRTIGEVQRDKAT